MALLRKLNIGCGRNPMEGWVNLDGAWNDKADYHYDLESGQPTDFADDTFEEMWMSHVLEHINKPLPMMQELWRIAKDGCLLVVDFPYGSSNDADEDPTHVRRIFENSFMYFGQPAYWRADYGYRGDWDVEEVVLKLDEAHPLYSDPEAMLKRLPYERNIVSYGHAKLYARKPARPPKKELMRRFKVSVLA